MNAVRAASALTVLTECVSSARTSKSGQMWKITRAGEFDAPARRLGVEAHERANGSPVETREDVLVAQVRLAVIDADPGARDSRVGARRQRDGDQIGDALTRAISSARVVDVDVDDDVE